MGWRGIQNRLNLSSEGLETKIFKPDMLMPTNSFNQIMEARIRIITLSVSDLARSIPYSRDGLGFPTEAPEMLRLNFLKLLRPGLRYIRGMY